MEFSWIEILTYFIIYSFLGWVLESIYRSIGEKKIINTGFLKGPFCPIYGFGAIIMLLFLEEFESRLLLLFFIAFIVLTIWEYLVGVLLEKMFHTKYWDYSHKKLQFQGRICLSNSVYWGILGVIFIKYIHPFINSNLEKIDNNIRIYLVVIIVIILIIDMIKTIVNVKNIQKTLEKIEEINEEIKEKLKEISNIGKEIETDIDTDIEKAREAIRKIIKDLKKRRKNILSGTYQNIKRLKKAFPTIDTKEIRDVLDKKIELKNRVKNKVKKKSIDR